VGAPEPVLVITAHVDTIRPAWHWDGRARVEDGIVFGLGAVDDKAGVVAALLALRLLREAGVDPADSGVAVAFTVDEEVNGTGSVAVADALAPEYAIVLEGTGLSPGVAEAGLVAASVEVRGRSVHGSLPEFGDNAIVKAARLILDLEDAAFTRVEHPLLGAALPCVERITGGSELYAVPDRASFGLDTKVVPGVTAAEVAAEMGEICLRYEASLDVEEAVDAFEVPEGSAIVEALEASSRRITGATRPPAGVRGWTDAHNFVAVGSEAVVFGPGRLIGSAHQPDESVPVDDIVVCGRILCDLTIREAEGLRR
jgi:acetylornithine deacetylase/succinyl-diaminopimelate desuccinylase-like protein